VGQCGSGGRSDGSEELEARFADARAPTLSRTTSAKEGEWRLGELDSGRLCIGELTTAGFEFGGGIVRD
jgi:hypothetical protein